MATDHLGLGLIVRPNPRVLRGRGARVRLLPALWVAAGLFGVGVLGVGFLGAGGALASGTKLKLKSDGFGDGYYYTLDFPTGQNSRYITEYSPGDTDPMSVITRARVALVNSGESDGSHFQADLRLEDPQNPGYPDLSPLGLIAEADANSLVGCRANQRWVEYFSFGNGAGVPAPLGRFYLTVVAPPGQGGIDACGLQIDSSSPPQGAAKFYLSNFDHFENASWNHISDIEVFETGKLDLRARWHGSSRYPGDSGRPVVFAIRPSAQGVTDDFIGVSLTVDNQHPTSVFKVLELAVERNPGLAPGLGWKPVTSAFRQIGSGTALPKILELPRGRTILRLEVPRPIPSRFVDLAPKNMVFRAELRDANDPDTIHDFEESLLGLRPMSGSPDDGSGESLFLVQTPTLTDDALAVRFRATDMPTTASYTISSIQIEGGELGGEDLDGFDAVELRREDPILVGPDLSPAGLLRRVGLHDGRGEITLGPVMTELTLDIPDLDVDPVNAPIGNLWAQVLLNPGDSVSPNVGTFLGGDGTGQTLMTDSFFARSGLNRYTRDLSQNYQIRLLLDGRQEPQEAGATRSSSTEMRLPPGGFITSGDGIQINMESYLREENDSNGR